MKWTLFMPLVVAALLTGCTVRAELDYDRTSQRAAAEVMATGDGGGQRQAIQEVDRIGLHVAVNGSLLGGDEPKAGATSVAPGPADAPTLTGPTGTVSASSPAAVVRAETRQQAIHARAINIHIGDIHHHEHTHVHVDRNVKVVTPWTETRCEDPVPSRESEPAETTAADERCERLRQEHEARVGRWLLLFDSPRATPHGEAR